MRIWSLLIIINLAVMSAFAQQSRVEKLWPNGAPGAVGTQPVDEPTLSIFLPEKAKANGTGVVICPGGGYVHLAFDYEGTDVARWFNTLGVAGSSGVSRV